MSHFLANDRDLEKKSPADDGAETAGTEAAEETRHPTQPDGSPQKDADGTGEEEKEADDEEEEDEDTEDGTAESVPVSTPTTSDEEQQQPRHET